MHRSATIRGMVTFGMIAWERLRLIETEGSAVLHCPRMRCWATAAPERPVKLLWDPPAGFEDQETAAIELDPDEALLRFAEFLPDGTLASITAAGHRLEQLDERIVNWFAGCRLGHGPSRVLADLRAQAAQSYPLLPFIIWELARAGDDSIDKAIAERAPLAVTLQRIFGAAWFVRLLHQLRPDFLPEGAGIDLTELLRTVCLLEPSQVPQSPQCWESFRAMQFMIAQIVPSHAPERVRVMAAKDMFRKAAGNWQAHPSDQLLQAYPGHVAQDLARNLVRPALVKLTPLNRSRDVPTHYNRASRLLFQGRGPKHILRICELWHKRQIGIHFRLSENFPPTEAGELRWEPLTAPFQATNGHLIVPLTDKPMLMQEAFSLSHCVGTYGYACAFDGRHVLSVRTEGGIPIATLAVKQHLATPAGIQHAISEFVGKSNGTPPAEARLAVNERIDAIVDGRLPIDLESLKRAQAERQPLRLNLGEEEMAGDPEPSCYDHDKPGALDMALALYGPLLPTRVRRGGLPELVRVCSLGWIGYFQRHDRTDMPTR